MSKRWSPGDGDWVRVLDRGCTAVWVRPETDGATIAVYLGDYYDTGVADIWQVRVLRGSDLLDTVMDKPHRVHWVADRGDWDPSGVVPSLCEGFKVVEFDHQRVPSSHYGHPRCNYNRSIWLGDPLPRKVHEAVGYGER
jgi:hypothetical protein